MRKESLSLMTIKTLLAVIIFAGMGTIIIGGGYIIGEYYKNTENEVVITPANYNQETKNYYNLLEKNCKNSENRYQKNQCYTITIQKISETDPEKAVKLCEIDALLILSKNDCYAMIAERISSTCFTEVYNKALMICDKIERDKLRKSCKENCKLHHEQEKENNISNWQTYQNEEYGFEVRYPEDWEEIDKTPAIMSFAYKDNENNLIQIRSMDRENDISLIKQIKGEGDVEPELIKINNKDFYFLKVSMAGLIFYEYYIENKNKIFVISMMNMSADLPKNAQDESDIKYPTDEELSEELNNLRSMISTFKFIEKDEMQE
ncbi:hypothetical protein KAT63_00955 [Candidatus Parcubacteria bacterium]|nr:hypothetical protein [Candidatus Parcubacteria bacterium]